MSKQGFIDLSEGKYRKFNKFVSIMGHIQHFLEHMKIVYRKNSNCGFINATEGLDLYFVH